MLQSKECWEYHLIIICVKMKVKFPCRMKIQNGGSMVTSEVANSSQDKYIFNQEVVLKDDSRRQCLELVFNLVTSMGSKYLAGAVKLYHTEMLRSEGQNLHLSLARCMDPEARCQIKINKIVSIGRISFKSNDRSSEPNKSKINNLRLNQYEQSIDRSPTMKNIHGSKHQGSKTEYQFPVAKDSMRPPEWGNRSRFQTVTHNIQSPQGTAIHNLHSPSRIYQLSQYECNERDGSHADNDHSYRQAYLRLQEKFRKESQQCKDEVNKRKILENNQSALKLQVMKYKLKMEAQQKSITELGNRMKEGQNALWKLREKETEAHELNKDLEISFEKVKSLENIVRVLSQQLQQAKEALKQKNSEQTFKVRELELHLEETQNKLDSKCRQIELQAASNKQAFKDKEKDLIKKTEQLQSKTKTLNLLEKSMQDKNIEFERKIQHERNSFRIQIEQQQTKRSQVERQLKSSLEEIERLSEQVRNFEITRVRDEYERKMLQQQYESLKSSEFLERAEKYPELLRQHKLVLQQKTLLESKLQTLSQSRFQRQQSVLQQLQAQVEYFKHLFHESQSKLESKIKAINELERTLSETKAQEQKTKRSLDDLVHQLNLAQEKEKNAKRALQAKEKSFFAAETQHAALKERIKNIDQINQLEIDKIKNNLQKTESLLQALKNKNKQSEGKIKSLQSELSDKNAQLKDAQQCLLRQQQKVKSKQKQVEDILKQCEQKLLTLQKINSMLRGSEKEAVFRMKKLEVDSDQKDGRMDKLRSQSKRLQQKCLDQQQLLRSKNAQLVAITEQNQQLQERLTITENQLSELKSQQLLAMTEKHRQAKLLQSRQDDLIKLADSLQQQNQELIQKQEKIQQLTSEINTANQEMARLRIKLEMARKQVERFKDQIIEAIGKNNSIILAKDITAKDHIEIAHKTDYNITQFINLVNIHFKQLRQHASKQKESVSRLQAEVGSLEIEKIRNMEDNLKKQYDLKNQIGNLENQLQRLMEERQIESLNFTTIITEMKKRIEEGQLLHEQLNSQIEELNFTVNSNKLDYEAFKDENYRKLSQITKLNAELQEKNKEYLEVIAQLQEQLTLLDNQLQLTQRNLEEHIGKGLKQHKIIEELTLDNQQKESQIQLIFAEKKRLADKTAITQYELTDIKEENSKLKSFMDSQEAKYTQIKEFVATLIKEKEGFIRKEILLGEEILKLENDCLQKSRDNEVLTQQIQRLVKNNEELKDNIKAITTINRDISSQLCNLKSQNQKLQQKIRQREALIDTNSQQLCKLESQLHKSNEKLRQQSVIALNKQEESAKQFRRELQVRQEKIKSLERALEVKIADFCKLQNKNIEIQQRMYEQHQTIISFEDDLNRKKEQVQSFKAKIAEFDSTINELNDELRVKQEQLFDLSGKNYALEIKNQAQNQDKYEALNNMEVQFTSRYDSLCCEYEQKLQMIQKEKSFYKKQLQEKDRQISKKNMEIKSLETHESSTRKSYEERFKRLEQQKNSMTSAKNNQLHRLNDQNRVLLQNLKHKQTQARKIGSELQIARRSVTNLEYRMREYEEQLASLKRQHHSEMQLYKKKELQSRNYKQSMVNHHWSCQREIKKILHGFVRSYLDLDEGQDMNKIFGAVRSLETSILEAISFKAFEGK